MILRAIRELGIDPAASILIGDSERDIEAGRAAGVGRLVRVERAV
jgi:D-glycero-D-manno-heptose 1,7-bisphosphate phosphatase